MAHYKITHEQEEEIVKTYTCEGGASCESIGRKFGISAQLVSNILTEHGITYRTYGKNIPTDITKQIREMYDKGSSIKEIADKLELDYNITWNRATRHGKMVRRKNKKQNYKYKDAIEAHIQNIQNRNKSKVPNIEALVSSEVTDVIAERTAEIEKKLYNAMETALALTDEYEQICIERTKILENEIQRQTDDITRQREELNERETMLKKAQKYINK